VGGGHTIKSIAIILPFFKYPKFFWKYRKKSAIIRIFAHKMGKKLHSGKRASFHEGEGHPSRCGTIIRIRCDDEENRRTVDEQYG
jgi:hypothetical protein